MMDLLSTRRSSVGFLMRFRVRWIYSGRTDERTSLPPLFVRWFCVPFEVFSLVAHLSLNSVTIARRSTTRFITKRRSGVVRSRISGTHEVQTLSAQRQSYSDLGTYNAGSGRGRTAVYATVLTLTPNVFWAPSNQSTSTFPSQ